MMHISKRKDRSPVQGSPVPYCPGSPSKKPRRNGIASVPGPRMGATSMNPSEDAITTGSSRSKSNSSPVRSRAYVLVKKPATLFSPSRLNGSVSQVLAKDEDMIDEADLILPEEVLAVDSPDDLPVRYLDDFSIHNEISHQLVTIDEVEDPNVQGGAYFVGRVSAKQLLADLEDELEELEGESNDKAADQVTEVLICSSSLTEIWRAEEPEPNGLVSDESELWLRTKYAWYILSKPSDRYKHLYLNAWIQHKLILLMAFLAPKTTSPAHVRSRFLRNEARWAEYEFARRLTLQDLGRYIPEALRYSVTNQLSVCHTVLFENLCLEYDPGLAAETQSTRSASVYETDSMSTSSHVSSINSIPDSKLVRSTRIPPGRQQSTETFCTPLVQSIARKYFPSLQIDEGDPKDDGTWETKMQGDRIPLIDIGIPKHTPNIEVGTRKASDVESSLKWVKVDNSIYKPGDTVLIRPDSYSESKKTALYPSELSEHVWFGMIISLYYGPLKNKPIGFKQPKIRRNVYAHILWFEPASKCSLGELGHPRELIVIDECESDVDVESFIATWENKRLGTEEDESVLDQNASSFFYRYYWKRDEDDAFIDVETFLSNHLGECPSCMVKKTQQQFETPRVTCQGVSISGIEYHVDDFVYFLPEETGREYSIGQITKLNHKEAKVRELKRPDRSTPFFDDRRLIATDPLDIRNVAVAGLEGKCSVFVQDSGAGLQDDEFFCPDLGKVRYCKHCTKPSEARRHIPPLKGLDIFSGAGGLSLGLESTGLVQTKWAVEYDPSSALTFRRSHPNCVVYNACVNEVLRQAYAEQNGHDNEPVLSLSDRTELPPFPRRGQVDIVSGGPPCQGFTRLNHCPKADDPRNHLVLTFLSAVDMLRPCYVVMENVRGLLTFRLGARQLSLNAIEGGIQRGFVKLVKRLLTAMNYQVRYGILHAGQCGAPQNRRRVVFIAAQRGLSLPELPQPTHVIPNMQSLGVIVDENHSFTVSKRRNYAAPLGAVTVMDMIGDLPRWEWKNPHVICPATPHQKASEKERSRVILTVDSTKKPFGPGIFGSGPDHPMHYSQDVKSRYQLNLRGDCIKITQHWCPNFHLKEIERICSIPMSSTLFVDHNDLPTPLRLSLYGDPRYHGRYGRLNGDGHFKTMLGQLTANSPAGQILHPSLHRIITIREMARSQGFPDSVEFQLDRCTKSIRAITQQIGNAVPIPMAAAVGRQIVKTYCKELKNGTGQSSSET